MHHMGYTHPSNNAHMKHCYLPGNCAGEVVEELYWVIPPEYDTVATSVLLKPPELSNISGREKFEITLIVYKIYPAHTELILQNYNCVNFSCTIFIKPDFITL